ncbi:hypothetical protein Tco_0575285 [Tanacetum coccineum]
MAPKRATRSTPVTTTPAPTATTTTSVTNAQLQAMIDQGVTAALAARDANRNGDDSHTLMETKARLSREAWRRSMDASDLAHGEVMSLRTTVLGQMSEIRELHAADRRRQAVTSEMLKADHRRSAEMRELRTADRTRQQQLIQTLTVMQSLQGQVTTLQGQVTALQGQVTALHGQQGPARGPAQPELPEEAGSSS